MTPKEVARLAIDWHRSTRMPLESTVRVIAFAQALDQEETKEALDWAENQARRRKELGYWPIDWPRNLPQQIPQ